jgi:O-antigen ligase
MERETLAGMSHTAGIRRLGPGPGRSGVLPARGIGAVPVEGDRRLNPVIRWAFYGYVFSLLFESPGGGISVELTTITAALLMLSTLLQPRACYRIPPPGLWCFGIYFYVCLMLAAFSPDPGSVLSRLFVLGQLLVVTWVAFSLMCDPSVARGAWLSLASACAVLALLSITGLTPPDTESRSGRLGTFGLDHNQIAACLSLGVLVLAGFAYGAHSRLLRPGWVAWPLVALIAAPIIQTGSRGGLLALAAGLIALALGAGSLGARLRNAFVVLLLLLFFGLVASQSGMVRERFTRTLETGDMTIRERTYPLAWEMFLERPLTGWGAVVNTQELGRRVNHPAYPRMDPHNLVLYALTATGLLGAVPLLLGVGLCVAAAWKARTGLHGAVPFAMMVTLLVADMSVSGIHWKQHWLVLAYALAAGISLAAVPVPGRYAAFLSQRRCGSYSLD